MNVAAWLERAARSAPDRVAILCGAHPWARYGELASRVARLAAGAEFDTGTSAPVTLHEVRLEG